MRIIPDAAEPGPSRSAAVGVCAHYEAAPGGGGGLDVMEEEEVQSSEEVLLQEKIIIFILFIYFLSRKVCFSVSDLSVCAAAEAFQRAPAGPG